MITPFNAAVKYSLAVLSSPFPLATEKNTLPPTPNKTPVPKNREYTGSSRFRAAIPIGPTPLPIIIVSAKI